MTLHVGTLPATRQTWKAKTARDLLADIISQYPSSREDKWRREFISAVRTDDDYLEAVCDYAFDAAMLARSRQATAARAAPTAEVRAVTAQRRADEAKAHAERVSFVKEQIILLNQEMPNGKRARFCTLDYMFRLGGAFRRIGKQGSTKLVGEAFSEEQYRAKLKGLV